MGRSDMEDDQRKKHKDFIEPGSKEDAEATAVLNEVLGEVGRQSRERELREKAEAEKERERRSSLGLPLGDDCYFARLASGMHVIKEDLFGLFEDLRIAVHLTEGSVAIPSSTDWQPDPKDYRLHEREMVSALLRLRERGGFVWLEYQHSNKARVGVVTPGTGIEVRNVRRAAKDYGKKGFETGTEVALVTMRLKKVVYLQGDEATTLRACRPLMPDHVSRSLVSWRPACGTSRLVSMFDGREEKGMKARWNDLPDALKMAVCAEFLRHHETSGVPRLKHLLLPPTNVGRNVDIFGMAEDGTLILAQVPFRSNKDKETFEAKKKAERLRKYENTGANLICFIPSVEGSNESPVQEQKLFEDESLTVRDEVIFVPIGQVLEWVEGQPAYAKRLFSA